MNGWEHLTKTPLMGWYIFHELHLLVPGATADADTIDVIATTVRRPAELLLNPRSTSSFNSRVTHIIIDGGNGVLEGHCFKLKASPARFMLQHHREEVPCVEQPRQPKLEQLLVWSKVLIDDRIDVVYASLEVVEICRKNRGARV